MTKKILIVLVLIVVGGVGYYAISPLFNNIKVDEALPGKVASPTAQVDHTPASGASMTHDATSTEQMMAHVATVTGTTGHPASGTVRIVKADGKQYVRYENFKTINGPDIYVYLSKDLDAKDYISLGKVKATEGNINYEVPAGTNASDYKYVLTWCKTFSVLFNSAQIH